MKKDVLISLKNYLQAWMALRKSIMTTEQLHSKVLRGEPVKIIDVRTSEEYEGIDGRVPGARLVPMSELKNKCPDIIRNCKSPVVFVCSHGVRSTLAFIKMFGIAESMYTLKGGMLEWNKKGYETTKNPLAKRKAVRATQNC